MSEGGDSVASDEKEEGTPQQEMQGGDVLKPQSEEEPEEASGADTAGDAAKEQQG